MTYPKITDTCNHDYESFAMLSEVFSTVPGKVIAAVRLCRKCYQRDRRVGPKCRRVEIDWYGPRVAANLGSRQNYPGRGRRSTDTTAWFTLPTKSDRLAREAAERAGEEIPVSEGMSRAGRLAGHEVKALCDDWPASIYRAMERVRRQEMGQGAAPYGAQDARQAGGGEGPWATTESVVGAVVKGGVWIKDRRVNNERRGRGDPK